ncbi:MAG: hypothetical protein JHD16_04515 [Solirubrobacteraceae bacterium]|nr:hypothetical protein [Solirubrobacteraceae bacterium]
MTLTATPVHLRPARRPSAAPVLGGEAWVVPHEPGGYPWLTATPPRFRVVDQRVAR